MHTDADKKTIFRKDNQVREHIVNRRASLGQLVGNWWSTGSQLVAIWWSTGSQLAADW